MHTSFTLRKTIVFFQENTTDLEQVCSGTSTISDTLSWNIWRKVDIYDAALNRKAFFFLLPLSMLCPFLGGQCQTETRRGDRKEGTSVPSNVSVIVDVFLEDEALKWKFVRIKKTLCRLEPVVTYIKGWDDGPSLSHSPTTDFTKCIIYKHYLFQINVKKILAVINATYAVAKRKPEKIRLAGTRTLTSAIPVQRSNQLS